MDNITHKIRARERQRETKKQGKSISEGHLTIYAFQMTDIKMYKIEKEF